MHKILKEWNKFPKLHKLYISGVGVTLSVLAFLPSEKVEASKNTLPVSQLENNVKEQLIPGKRHSVPLEIKTEVAEVTSDLPKLKVKQVKIQANDNISKIFSRENISAKTALLVSKGGKLAKNLIKKLRPGDELELRLNDEGELVTLAYLESKTDTILIELQDDGSYQSRKEVKETDITEAFAYADIQSNFWHAGIDAGLSEALIMNLADIFGWDIDFALDLRKGDNFNVVYEKRYIDGEYIGPGKILIAEFNSQNDKYTAVRHSDGNYYTPEGRSMRKAFLRAPVNFKYISSSFNPRRLHPVTGKVRPHRGIDYAAKTGTPVVSSGNGKVVKSGFSRLNGNYVFIEHGNTYVTKYLHLNKRKVRKGQKVKQGQLIGTVGSTGRVTGPHLHYEFLVHGVHRNPKTVKLPKSLPIDNKYKAEFTAQTERMLKLINNNKRILLAKTN